MKAFSEQLKINFNLVMFATFNQRSNQKHLKRLKSNFNSISRHLTKYKRFDMFDDGELHFAILKSQSMSSRLSVAIKIFLGGFSKYVVGQLIVSDSLWQNVWSTQWELQQKIKRWTQIIFLTVLLFIVRFYWLIVIDNGQVSR